MNHASETAQRGGSFPRRTVLAGGVWAVPVVVVATAAPAFAASNTLKVTAVCDKGQNGDNGHNDYQFTVSGTPNTSYTITQVKLGSQTSGTLTIVVTTDKKGVATFKVNLPTVAGGSVSASVTSSPGGASQAASINLASC